MPIPAAAPPSAPALAPGAGGVRACAPGAGQRAVHLVLGCALLWLAAGLSGCEGRAPPPQTGGAALPPLTAAGNPDPAAGRITVTGDDRIAASLTWRAPQVEVDAEALPALRRQAARALARGQLYEDAEAAIPIQLALLARDPLDRAANDGLGRAFGALIAAGDAALAEAGDDAEALRRAREIAAVARSVGMSRFQAETLAYLTRVDQAERLWELNIAGERALARGVLGVPGPAGDRERDADSGRDGPGALALFRQVLALAPDQPRATQGLAAVESALIRRAEDAAAAGDFDAAEHWLQQAVPLRPGYETIMVGRERVETLRQQRIARLHDEGLALLARPGLPNRLDLARKTLAEMLLIAAPGHPTAADLRARIDLATHYGQMRPGQRFTDALDGAGRGPTMVVVPHGGFRMGASSVETEADDAERPQRYVRFDRGFAMARTEITVAQFRRFVDSSGYVPRAVRRGHSLVYDERSGAFVRRSGVDWRHDYRGEPAAETLPAIHVSPKDAEAYARWLSERSGQRYRLPSEAEFEYALRAGSTRRYGWGDGVPPPRSGNFAGQRDRSPGGRTWGNAFPGYGDGHWGPAPAGLFPANPFGLHDMDGNVSEWVADCWHDGYRRAPTKGEAWVNPGCRVRVLRGGAWSSSPAHTRSAWRSFVENDVTNARTGFRVVRDL